MSLKKQLGQRIQILRKNRKFTQEKFAELIGIDSINVSKIENGNNYPTAETLTSIAMALNVDIYELFIFRDGISYEDMKIKIMNALEDKKNIIYIYQLLFNKKV